MDFLCLVKDIDEVNLTFLSSHLLVPTVYFFSFLKGPPFPFVFRSGPLGGLGPF